MTFDQLPLNELTTPAGIAAAAILIRQVIEMAKGSFLPWLDRGNERKGVFILAAVLYTGWLIAYGSDLGTDGFMAMSAFWACSVAALGSNEAVDAAKGVVAKNVAQAAPATATVAATAPAPATAQVFETAGPAVAPAAGAATDSALPAAAAATVSTEPVTTAPQPATPPVDEDDSTAAPDTDDSADRSAGIEAGPDLDLDVDDEDEDEDEEEDDEEEGDGLPDPAFAPAG